jgi:hypothetical protein
MLQFPKKDILLLFILSTKDNFSADNIQTLDGFYFLSLR